MFIFSLNLKYAGILRKTLSFYDYTQVILFSKLFREFLFLKPFSGFLSPPFRTRPIGEGVFIPVLLLRCSYFER